MITGGLTSARRLADGHRMFICWTAGPGPAGTEAVANMATWPYDAGRRRSLRTAGVTRGSAVRTWGAIFAEVHAAGPVHVCPLIAGVLSVSRPPPGMTSPAPGVI